jgi:uncharacterized protein (TIGR02300 family)
MTVAVRAIKPDLGVKRRCTSCDAPFYDLMRSPIQCPKCGTAFNANARSALSSAKRFKASVSRTRARTAPVPVAKIEEVKRPKTKSDETEADEEADGDDLILDSEDDED